MAAPKGPICTLRSVIISASLLLCIGSLPSAAKDVDTLFEDSPSPWGTAFGPDVINSGDVSTARNNDNIWFDESYAGLNGTGDDQALGRRGAGDFWLRIMPLGASITQGVASSDGNGYRKHLRDQLRFAGWDVNMVGSKRDGTMRDRDNEGHPGWVITEVHSAFTKSKHMKPNVILINVGTNDCNGNIDPGNGGQRMRDMLDDIYSSISGVTVILSTLVPGTTSPACHADLSGQYRALVSSYRAAGRRIALADMHNGMSPSEVSSDRIHPNDTGYRKMAAIWWDSIQKVANNLQPPDRNAMDDAESVKAATCAKEAHKGRGPIQTQTGSGYEDGNYVHKTVKRGILQKFTKDNIKSIDDGIPSHVFFGNIVKNEANAPRESALDEIIRIYHDEKGKNTYYYRKNNGGGSFNSPVTFNVDQNCDNGPAYWFADFNNDGLDDFWCIGKQSQVTVSLNRGGNPPKFQSIGQVVVPHSGFSDAVVRIADIDGDGRADYCLIAEQGNIRCSRNGGQGDSYYWQGFTTQNQLRDIVFTGKNKGNADGVNFGDINGDFRSDWLYVGDTGDVDTYINQRGWGSGIVPNWVHAGTTHTGMGVKGVRKNIKFGKIYGSNRLDYIWLKEEDDRWDMHVWENVGAGGTKVKGDGVFYCDMRGTGADDYVWIFQDGHTAEIYENIHSPPNWKIGPRNLFSVTGPRVGIHLADWNGDGKCDVLVQNKATGALTMWRNDYNRQTDTYKFTNVGVVSGAATCAQGWGVSIFDRGLRLADIDGDGRADYLCLERNGRVTGWLNSKDGMRNQNQIKFSEGWDRSNMRFADVEGSGRADLIHLNKYTGAGTVFQNMGPTPAGGSSFTWKNRGVLYAAIDRGETMHFANLGGLGRADLVQVGPVTNRAYTWFNECPGGAGSGGDDGPIVNPGLPPYTNPNEPGPGEGGNGSGGGEVFIDPAIWSESQPTASCQAPCTLILPPWTLRDQTTISFPLVTETIKQTYQTTSNGVTGYGTRTITTVISIPPVTTNLIHVSNIFVPSSTSGIVKPTSSVIPPPIVLTEPTHGATYTYSPQPYPTSTSGSDWPPPFPFPGDLHIRTGSGPGGPLCRSGCGTGCKAFCNQPGGGGGGGGGGGLPCIGPACGDGGGNCAGPGCGAGGGGSGPGGGGGNNPNDPDDPEDEDEEEETSCGTQTATSYWVSCSGSDCKTTSTSVFEGCSVTGGTTTTNPSCPRPTYDANLENVGGSFPAGVSISSTRTSVSAYASVDSSYLTVYNNHFTFSGTAVSVRDAGTPRTISFGPASTKAIVYPPVIKSKPVLNKPELVGITGPPLQDPLPTATTTITEHGVVTSTSTSKPPSDDPPPAPKPRAYVELWFSYYNPIEEPWPSNNYIWYAQEVGKQYDVCKDNDVVGSTAASRELTVRNVKPPKLTYTFSRDMPFVGDCLYIADKEEPGVVTCKDATADWQCTLLSGDNVSCTGSQTSTIYKPLVKCSR